MFVETTSFGGFSTITCDHSQRFTVVTRKSGILPSGDLVEIREAALEGGFLTSLPTSALLNHHLGTIVVIVYFSERRSGLSLSDLDIYVAQVHDTGKRFISLVLVLVPRKINVECSEQACDTTPSINPRCLVHGCGREVDDAVISSGELKLSDVGERVEVSDRPGLSVVNNLISVGLELSGDWCHEGTSGKNRATDPKFRSNPLFNSCEVGLDTGLVLFEKILSVGLTAEEFDAETKDWGVS